MILTPKFVFIHWPKTGGTFVTQVIRRIHKKDRGPLARLAGRLTGFGYEDLNKHGPCREIPPGHAGLPIVSTVRNPYDHLVSSYEYAWWKRHPDPWVDWEALRRTLPSCPDFTFPEYATFSTTLRNQFPHPPGPPEDRLGFQSETFVRLFFRDPEAAWPRIDDAYIAARRWEQDMHPVRFLRTENLNADLRAFLAEHGYAPERIAFLENQDRIYPEGSRRSRESDWRAYYTPELKALVRRRERLLFAVFPEYDR
jgi:hypothetical protein